MVDSESGIHRIVPDKGDSPHRRREKIIVLATIFLLVIAVLTLMRRGTNSPAEAGIDSSGSDYTGGPDASGAGGGGVGAQLPGEIGSIPEQTAGLLNNRVAQQLANTRANLKNARRGRQRARNRAEREHKTITRERHTITRQKHEIAKLQHHPAHAGKKNAGEHWVARKPKATG